ncbi:MAG: type II toxin-antitoxin system RelE/ParE family toxin [Bacteroidota bacterium]
MNIIWSPLAVEQVRDIASYIALDKPSVAVQWAEKIFNSVERLSDFPDSGRIVPEIKRNEIREIVQGNYRVIYKAKPTEILILVVKSYRQKLKEDEIKA